MEAPQQARPETPTFMFGFDRSGTTLLSMMVGAHPEIAVPLSTTGMWYDVAETAAIDSIAEDDHAGLIDRILAHERIRLWDQVPERLTVLRGSRAGDYGSIIAAFYAEYARLSGKPFWASMDIATLDNLHRVNHWLPESRFVHIVRDGRDVALSHQTYRYGAGNIAECAVKWENRVARSLGMGAMIDPARYLVIRYEDLVLDPEAVLQRLCDFLGVTYSAKMLDYRSDVARKVPEDKMQLWPSLKEPPKASKVDRWRREMRRSQRILFEQRAGRLLKELGYEVFEQPPRSFAAILLEIWYCMGQGGRFERLRRIFLRS
jgi:hypothetical protein